MWVGVDCGTQSTKVVIVNPACGSIVAQGQRSHALQEGANGRREQDPQDWVAALEGAFADASSQRGIASALSKRAGAGLHLVCLGSVSAENI